MMIDKSGIEIVYDGACPFCTGYARLIRLREAVGPVRIIDARSDHPLVAEIAAAGHDLDKGMAAKFGGRLYFGDECVHLLATLSEPKGVSNRLMCLLRSRRLARFAYPIMVGCRNVALFALGHGKINSGARRGADGGGRTRTG
ncbi:MAG: DUF393 domain-containing protein [Hyphomicrobiales bacterium]|nr:DUF393 domain-containing protein [Hyphomicrobiales bacterium]